MDIVDKMPETKQLSAPFVREVMRYLRAPTPDSTTPGFMANVVNDCAKLARSELALNVHEPGIAPIDRPVRVFVSPDCKLQRHLLSAKDAPFTLYQDYFTDVIPQHYHLKNDEFLVSQTRLRVVVGDRAFDQPGGTLNVYTVEPGTIIGIPRRFPHQTVPLHDRVAALLALSIPAMERVRGQLDYHTKFKLSGWKQVETQPEFVKVLDASNP